MKNYNNTIGNRTQDLLASSAVPQPTAQLHAPLISALKYQELWTQWYSITSQRNYIFKSYTEKYLDRKHHEVPECTIKWKISTSSTTTFIVYGCSNGLHISTLHGGQHQAFTYMSHPNDNLTDTRKLPRNDGKIPMHKLRFYADTHIKHILTKWHSSYLYL